jgi:hypothetical protein
VRALASEKRGKRVFFFGVASTCARSRSQFQPLWVRVCVFAFFLIGHLYEMFLSFMLRCRVL